MNRSLVVGFLCGVVLLVGLSVVAGPMSQSPQASLPGPLAAQMARACIMPSGGWTIVDCSNAAAAASGALNEWSRYIFQCGDDSYIAMGGSTVTADANDGYLPEGAWAEIATTDSVKYFSCLNINADSDCRYVECQ